MAELGSMMELFVEECNGLLQDYVEVLSMAKREGRFSPEKLNELFQITHTLKGDATMMLFESIVIPVKAFEQLLAHCKSEKEDSYERISKMLILLHDFLESEMTKIAAGAKADGDGQAIADRILETISTKECIKPEEQTDEKQQFYIAPEGIIGEVTQETTGVTQPAYAKEAVHVLHTGAEVLPEQNEPHTIRRRSITISEEELSMLQRIVQHGNEVESKLLRKYHEPDDIASKEVAEFRRMLAELRGWMERTSMEQFEQLTVKLRRVIEEISDTLGKDIELTIQGGNTRIERNRMSKISGTLLHLLRNCADHGIEMPNDRIAAGKPRAGQIMVKYSMTDNGDGVIIEVKDDGAGVDFDKVYQRAVDMALFSKDMRPSDEDIIESLFFPGFSTEDHLGEYSGRGVGLDAARRNIEELGGTLRAYSKQGEGMTFLARIGYAVKTFEGEEKTNEDFDSRR